MKLSVIVCTRNRAHAIIPCLHSIVQSLAHAAPVDAEIVVVDNGSEDNTSAVLKEWASNCSFPVNIQFEGQKGASKARNRGIQSARGEILVWTDDDCRLSLDHIKDVLRHDENDSGLVMRGGRVELGDPTDLPITVKTDQVSTRWNRQTHYAKNANLFDANFGCNMIIGCNMAMRRVVAERIGFFDERFGPGTSLPGAEDTDYFFRTYLAGITIEYVPDMVVFHYHGRKTNSDGYKVIKNYMISTGGLYAKYLFSYPNLCRQFYWDFKKALQEIFSGKSTYMPEIGFSYKTRVAFCILGAMKYYLASIRGLA